MPLESAFADMGIKSSSSGNPPVVEDKEPTADKEPRNVIGFDEQFVQSVVARAAGIKPPFIYPPALSLPDGLLCVLPRCSAVLYVHNIFLRGGLSPEALPPLMNSLKPLLSPPSQMPPVCKKVSLCFFLVQL
jgi:hypothetical protein